MAVLIKEIESYQNFGPAIHISNGLIELYALTGCGPRIIHLSLAGGKNIFWADETLAWKTEGLDLAFGKGDEYRPLGGHRLWSSPQHSINSLYPDTDPVDVALTPQGAILTAPVQKGLDLQFIIEIKMNPDEPYLSVRHRINYSGDSIHTISPWAITQLKLGGLAVFPQSKTTNRKKPLSGGYDIHPDRCLAFWPYSDMGDKRLTLKDDYISIRPDDSTRLLKFGTFNDHGYALYHNDGVVFKKWWASLPNATYPNFGCNFEIYTDKNSIELESIAPSSSLYAGQSATHEEEWFLFPEPNELSEEKLIEKYGEWE